MTVVGGRKDGTSEKCAETVRLLVPLQQREEEQATPESPSQTSKSSLPFLFFFFFFFVRYVNRQVFAGVKLPERCAASPRKITGRNNMS